MKRNLVCASVELKRWMLHCTARFLASCWKPGIDSLKSKSKPVTKHRRSILGQAGKCVKWNTIYGLRDPTTNGVECFKSKTGARIHGIFGNRIPRVAQSEESKSNPHAAFYFHSINNITNRYRGHHEMNPALHQILAPIPVKHHLVLLTNHSVGVSSKMTESAAFREKILEHLRCVQSFSGTDRVDALTVVGCRCHLTVKWNSLCDVKHATHLMDYIILRDREIRGLDNGQSGQKTAASTLDEFRASHSTVTIRAADNGGLLHVVDQYSTPMTMKLMAQPILLQGSGRMDQRDTDVTPTRTAVRWWWRNNDPSRPCATALEHLPTTAHGVSALICIPDGRLSPELLKALRRRNVEEVRETAAEALQIVDAFCQKQRHTPNGDVTHDGPQTRPTLPVVAVS